MRSPFIISRRCDEDLPVVAGGEGPYLMDEDGRRYLDASGGAAVSCLGHSNQAVLAAARAQLEKIAYAHTGFFHSRPAMELSAALVRVAPPPLTRACLVSGGSEAMETALKLARQYFVEIGQAERRFFIARRQSYHGNTLGALSAGRNEGRRQMFAPLLSPAFRHVSPCRFWRDGTAGRKRSANTPTAWARSWSAPLPKSAAKMCARLSPKPSPARPWGRFRRRRGIFAARGRFATATARC